jgi:hypothetical protein
VTCPATFARVDILAGFPFGAAGEVTADMSAMKSGLKKSRLRSDGMQSAAWNRLIQFSFLQASKSAGEEMAGLSERRRIYRR